MAHVDLRPYIESFAEEFGVAAEAAGEDASALAERLLPPLEASLRLLLLEALSAATDEITGDLAPGSVHVRLQGREPAFVVTVPERHEAPEVPAGPGAPPAAPVVAVEGEDGGTTRINLRLPDHLKAGADAAAAGAGLSVNAWLVRAVASALEPGPAAPPGPPGRGQRITGWVR